MRGGGIRPASSSSSLLLIKLDRPSRVSVSVPTLMQCHLSANRMGGGRCRFKTALFSVASFRVLGPINRAAVGTILRRLRWTGADLKPINVPNH